MQKGKQSIKKVAFTAIFITISFGHNLVETI